MTVVGIPETIGAYRIQREIGRGAMGVVYLARDTRLDRDVAIKALPPEFTKDPARLARFEREAKVLASLNHPNIGTIYALEEDETGRYLILELVEGRMLQAVLREGAMPVEQALDLCGQIAGALEASHDKGILHRDLKPNNVGITDEGQVKVLDFGLAKSSTTETVSPNAPTVDIAGKTSEGIVMGTPGYMSPEQTRGHRADARTDIWAFGCILYECLSGRAVFSGGTPHDAMAATLTAEPDWEALPPTTPVSLRELLRHCLEKNPDARLRHIAEARTRLGEVLAGEGAAGVRPIDVPNNLPAQVTSFIGRTKELEELKPLCAETRLLTLTGAGGCGKTRLSLELARELLGDNPDGVWFTELAALADPALVPQSAAAVLGVKEQAGEALTETLISALKGRTTLLILDNCEHLLDACAELGDALIRGCPDVRILATSRQALGIAGETTYRIPSLSFPEAKQPPDIAELGRFEAVHLFVDRARAAKPDFTLTDGNATAVAEICRRLDGIPLAIELAAARVRALSVDEIAKRLDDSFRLLTGGSRTALPRQQTLQATIEWSYDLLSEKEKALLRRLSVFAGGWTLEAAEKVCSDDAVIELKDDE